MKYEQKESSAFSLDYGLVVLALHNNGASLTPRPTLNKGMELKSFHSYKDYLFKFITYEGPLRYTFCGRWLLRVHHNLPW